MQNGVDIIVTTPGRLIDLLNKNFLHLNFVTCLVIDEFDKMLAQSFWPQVNFINSLLPGPEFCQKALFSASFDPKIRSFVDQLFNPRSNEQIFHNIKDCEMQITNNNRIENYYLLTVGSLNKVKEEVKEEFEVLSNEEMKKDWLKNKIRELVVNGKILIFVNNQKKAEVLNSYLKKELNLEVPYLYGKLTSYERHNILKDFKQDSDVLISTDVLGRGIDIENIQ